MYTTLYMYFYTKTCYSDVCNVAPGPPFVSVQRLPVSQQISMPQSSPIRNIGMFVYVPEPLTQGIGLIAYDDESYDGR